jgi:hypothetical protein
LAAAGKHISDIRDIVRQSPIAIIDELFKAVFSVGCASKWYNEDLRPAELN